MMANDTPAREPGVAGRPISSGRRSVLLQAVVDLGGGRALLPLVAAHREEPAELEAVVAVLRDRPPRRRGGKGGARR